MKEIRLKITAKSPLAIGWKKPGSVSEAADFISGSVIRGAVAAQMLRLAGNNEPEPGDDFHRLFVDDNGAVFRNGYPATAKITGKYPNPENSNQEMKPDSKNYQSEIEIEIPVLVQKVHVLPSTAVSSKAKGGFRQIVDGEDKAAHGVFDTLIDRFCAEKYGQLYDPNCPKDSGRVEPYSGFYSSGKNDGHEVCEPKVLHTEAAREFYQKAKDSYIKVSVSKRLLTRVGMNRRRSTSEDEILYSLEVLNERFATKHPHGLKQWHDVVYWSSIIVEDDDLAQHLTNFLNRHGDRFRLGGSASRGLGRVEIEAKCVDVNLQEAVKTRIQTFNKELNKRQSQWKELFGDCPLSEKRTYFTIDLQSDGVFLDNWKRTTVVTPSMLCQFAGIDEDKSLELHAAYSSYDYVSGWNSAWGLMKDIDLVTTKGSVYLFSTQEIDRWYEPLARLECRGIGERTLEGFGQIEVCNEFHQVFREEPA
ncbi:MAG: CRISPR-associated RAMP protein Csx10 [Cyanobacteria bacterium SBC]|nr:CRISPR-associated RAMP protein Csx10 [Cyanobacteria bacterium SBC]